MREVSAHYARVNAAEDELAKAWLVRVVERTAPTQLGEIPVSWIAAEAPPLIGDILREMEAAAPPGELSEQGRRRARELTRLRAGEAAAADAPRDLASLQAVLIETLRDEGPEPRPLAFSHAVERLAEIFGGIQAELTAALLEAAGPAPPAASEVAPAEDPSEAPAEAARPAASEGPLPGIAELHEALRLLIAEYRRYARPFALLMIDIDGLGRINEAYGREVGDRMLAAVSHAVEGQVRAVDRAFQLTEDEFCVLSPHQVASRVQPLADRLTSAVNGWQHHDGPRMSVTVGVASCPEHGEDPERLLAVAEEATYAAKASGRRFAVAGSGNQSFMQEPERT